MTTMASASGGSAPLGLMSCVREGSPQDMMELDGERNEPSKKRRFHPFRGLRKIFRREKRVDDACADSPISSPPPAEDAGHRSRSTSELLVEEPRKMQQQRQQSHGALGGGALSVSHDSVFTAEQRSSTSSEMDTAQSVESLGIQQMMQQTGVRAELLDAVRRRGRGRGDTSEDEEDLGLPRSPCNSPISTDKTLKDHPTKSHSTCSDGSLLSMGSSEMDEDSFGQHSRHSSKVSLHDRDKDRRPSQTQTAPRDSELELGASSNATPLSHSAARHKMSIRPKRTHGAPRRRRTQQVIAGSALPTTLEVNEEISTRSLTPEGTATTTTTSTRETISELYSASHVWSASTSTQVKQVTQLKSASLPPGLALASGVARLSRSRSNARDVFVEEDEEKAERKKDTGESFFGRFLARRSGKKKKIKQEDSVAELVKSKSEDVQEAEVKIGEKRTFSVDSGISKIPRSGPASRQRIQPIDIPASPEIFRKIPENITSPVPVPTPRTILPTVRNITVHSPPKGDVVPAPRHLPNKTEIQDKIEIEDLRSKSKDTKNVVKDTKVKITGLSTYQQRVLAYNDEMDNFLEDPSNNSDSETFTDSLMSTTTTQSDLQENEVKIINTNAETVTISCINSQMQASVNTINTKSTNQVIVSISSANTPETVLTTLATKSVDGAAVEQTSVDVVAVEQISVAAVEQVAVAPVEQAAVVPEEQVAVAPEEQVAVAPVEQVSPVTSVSVTKLQLKNPSKLPEFLKIQLHKVDPKPVTNVVLSTTTNERKFSTAPEDVEIIDKEVAEEIVQIPSKKLSKPTLIVSAQPRKSSLITTSPKPFLKKKSNSLELDTIKIEETYKLACSADQLSTKNVQDEVVMRKKSLAVQDEPELMKVFARRSLKLKDSEAETLSQQVLVLVEDNKLENSKRDSDKENEGSPEERRKSPKTPLTENVVELDVTLRKPSPVINNKLSVFGVSKYQRTVSLSAPVISTDNDSSSRRNKSFIEPKSVPTNFRSVGEKNFENEDYVPRFKRIQQRKEEWEQRAQQHLKKT